MTEMVTRFDGKNNIMKLYRLDTTCFMCLSKRSSSHFVQVANSFIVELYSKHRMTYRSLLLNPKVSRTHNNQSTPNLNIYFHTHSSAQLLSSPPPINRSFTKKNSIESSTSHMNESIIPRDRKQSRLSASTDDITLKVGGPSFNSTPNPKPTTREEVAKHLPFDVDFDTIPNYYRNIYSNINTNIYNDMILSFRFLKDTNPICLECYLKGSLVPSINRQKDSVSEDRTVGKGMKTKKIVIRHTTGMRRRKQDPKMQTTREGAVSHNSKFNEKDVGTVLSTLYNIRPVRRII